MKLSKNNIYRLLLFFSLLIKSNDIKTQSNLIYNGDFELYDTCPTNVSGPGDLQIEHCLGWTVASKGTSDYFNVCNNVNISHTVGVPKNALGFQYAYNGNGFTGGFFYSYDADVLQGHYREYIQGTLVNILQAGKKYNFSMQISLATYSSISIKNIDIVFTNSKISLMGSWKPLNNIPSITLTSTDYFKDTLNWTKLEGEFIASGTENYFTIGNFTDTLISDTARIIPIDPDLPDYSSYYYIDDVRLYKADDTPTSSCKPNISNIFTPNNDGINDFFKVSPCEELIQTSIYNRWGKLVFETKNPSQFWDGKNKDGEECVMGTYYYLIETKDKKFKGFVEINR
jgi:gliding motility-associated-like protein